MKIALLGAGGKMGLRCTDNLLKTDHDCRFVEIAAPGVAALGSRGVTPIPAPAALGDADVAILAVPDRLLRHVAAASVALLPPGALVMVLDPAAPLAGQLPRREDIACFVTHPCHPPVISDESDPEARRDFFGGVRARQAIVCALMQGAEEDYARGEAVARTIFAPVTRAHRITVEQMAILEPAMAETVVLTLMVTIREAMEEAVKAGVPEAAARDFLLGHMNVNIGILFGDSDARLSDGAVKAYERGRKAILREDWRDAFRPERILAEVRAITEA
ncbi:MAG: semialdehyde dehydrogenase [Lentisphaeria bacterium]|nr:semialdehyde dehydrogenase [Lentisphaeria bacterium]